MPTSERAEQLRKHVQEEAKQAKEGLLPKVSSGPELARRFGYANTKGVYDVLQRAGLDNEKRQIVEASKLSPEEIVPSSESAWVLGLLVGGGYVQEEKNTISLHSRDKELVDNLVPILEKYFGVNAKTKSIERNTKEERRIVYQIRLYGSMKTTSLGDLRSDGWTDTLRERHPWVFEKNEYTWAFLGGLFEKKGILGKDITQRKEDGRRIGIVGFNTTDLAAANLIAEMLVRVGIKKPLLNYDNKRPQGIAGISLRNREDMRYFAAHIYSLISEREKLLEVYRQLPLVEPNSRRGKVSEFSTEEVVKEYRRLRDQLGHRPTKREINERRKESMTRYSATVYALRFGNGNLTKALNQLEEIVYSSEE